MMFDHLAQPINIADVARSCHISRGHFISAFFASTGITPHQWVINLRIERAQALLTSTDLPIVEISLACGFYDQSHFSRTFLGKAGISPARWRQRERLGKQPVDVDAALLNYLPL